MTSVGGQMAGSDDEEAAGSIFRTSTEFKSRYRRKLFTQGKGGAFKEQG